MYIYIIQNLKIESILIPRCFSPYVSQGNWSSLERRGHGKRIPRKPPWNLPIVVCADDMPTAMGCHWPMFFFFFGNKYRGWLKVPVTPLKKNSIDAYIGGLELIGGLEHDFYFSIQLGTFHHPNWRTHSLHHFFQRSTNKQVINKHTPYLLIII